MKTEKKPLDSYLNRDATPIKKTVRASESIWDRVEKLSVKKNESLNSIVVAAIEKACDEEGV